MKPIKLTMEGFMTFNKKTVIDFTKLGEGGLFLITGDTGAGKSTIFDAIVYALYDELSGNIRKGCKIISDFASDLKESYVELEFIHSNIKYVIKRGIIHKKKRNGEDDQKKEVSLWIDGIGDYGSKKVSEINKKIIEIIGLDRNQFKQIAMLAQGEFMSLLNSDIATRENILRQIFNTGIYDSFKNKLGEMQKELKNKCLSNNEVLIHSLKNMNINENDEEYSKLNEWLEEGCDINKIEDIIELLESLNKADNKKLMTLKEEKNELEEKFNKINLEYESGKEINKLFEEKKILEKIAEEIREQKEAIIQKEDKYNLILNAEKVEGFYKDFLREKENFEGLIKRKEENTDKLEKVEDSVKTAEKDLKNVSDKNNKEIELLSSDITKLNEEIEKYDELDALKKELEKKEEEKKNNTELYNKVVSALDKLTKERESNIIEIDKLKNIEVERTEVNNAKENKEKLLDSLDSLKSNIASAVSLNKETLKLQKEFVTAEKKYNELNNAYEEARSAFLLGQAGIMAQSLKEGENCPVCGSKSHPHKAELKGDIPNEEEIKKLEGDKNKKSELSQKKASEININRGKLDSLINSVLEQLERLINIKLDPSECLEKGEEILKDSINKVNAEIEKLGEKIEKITADCNRKKSLEERNIYLDKKLIDGNEKLEETKVEKEKIEKNLIEVQSQFDLKKKSLSFENKSEAQKALDEKVNKKSALQKEINAAQERYNTIINLLEVTKAILKEIEGNILVTEKNRDENKKAYNKKLKENNFEEKAFLEILKNKADKEDIKKEIDDFKMKEVKNKAELEANSKNINNKEPKNIEALKEKCEDIQKKKNEKDLAFSYALNKLENNKKVLSGTAKLWDKQKLQQKQFLNVSELYKTASGNLNQKNKISIENYVQGFYFRRMIDAANKRFMKLTDGQFELMPKEKIEKTKTEKIALDLVVFDYYTGKSRPVSSLSGGESFKAALSLALGVSEVIQNEVSGKIDIDAVFIDEGFGSLDEESLEQAIYVLNSLSLNSNRMIGIISHVSELKEKINKKLVVKKEIDGSKVTMFC